ncbi:MAG: TadE/TadG family type IV pilus assembly protein [Pseudomonadota bacterium]
MRKILSIFRRDIRQDEEGVTAVEFALVGLPFIFMIIGIVEMALMFTAQSLLEASTAEASRQIRTGAVQQGGGETMFQDALCEFADAFIPCPEIQYQVVSMDSFEEIEDLPPPSFDDDGNLEDQEFTPGGVSDVVMIRTAYNYPIKTPLMQLALTNDSNGKRILMSTVVLKTEPYEFED